MNRIFIIILLFMSYIYFNTGIHSDDYIFLNLLVDKTLEDVIVFVFSTPLYLKNLGAILFDFAQFHFFKKSLLLYDFIKVITSFFVFYCLYRFIKSYINNEKSILLSFFVVLFPLHDATNYWVVGQYLLLTLGLIFLSHSFINENKLKRGFVVGLLGSFFSYASIPFNFGLSIIFLIKKEYKKFIYFVLPQIIYVIYYLIISEIFKVSVVKGSNDFSIYILIKQYILQVLTFIDSSIGPSFWLKIYFSLSSLTVSSLFIGLLSIFVFVRYFNSKKDAISWNLIISFTFIMLFAFGIFALTGYYPQIAFNLGNRVTIYGTLIVVLLIVYTLMNNKSISTIVFSIFIFSILGISDHWKNWNIEQKTIINNISNNLEIKKYSSEKLFVINSQYSALGDISHIEFFSESVAKDIFKFSTGLNYNVSPLNKRFIYKNNELIDTKYGNTFIVKDYIIVYDSLSDKIIKVDKNNISLFINKLNEKNRHWIQLLDNDSYILNVLLYFMPRLKYMFGN